MSGVIITVRLREMGNNVPSLAVSAIREILAEGFAYLQRDLTRSPANISQPYDTGYMRDVTVTRVVNQYQGQIESPADYTSYQEDGFFNVWAGRWIAGRYFMLDTERYMQEIADDITAKWLEEM